MSKLTKKEIQKLSDCIISEGFEYTFMHYSSFDEIKSEKFQELKTNYLTARRRFEDFLIDNGVEIDEENYSDEDNE